MLLNTKEHEDKKYDFLSHKSLGTYKSSTHWYFANIVPLTAESPMGISHLDVRHEFQASVIADSIS